MKWNYPCHCKPRLPSSLRASAAGVREAISVSAEIASSAFGLLAMTFAVIFTLFFCSRAICAEVEADAYIRYAPASSASNMSGRVATVESGWEYSYEYKFFDPFDYAQGQSRASEARRGIEKLPVTFSIGNDWIFIDNSVLVSLPSHLTAITTDIEAILPLFGLPGAYIGGGISPSFYSDDYSFESSSFRLPIRGFLAYQPDDKWTFVGGVEVCPRFKEPVWPIFGVIYKPTKELTFNLISDNPNIIYALNDRVALFAEGNFRYYEFEVTRGAAKNVILRYKETYAGGGVEFRFSKFTKTTLTAGGMLDRSFKYRDGGGKVDIDNGFYTELRMVSEF